MKHKYALNSVLPPLTLIIVLILNYIILFTVVLPISAQDFGEPHLWQSVFCTGNEICTVGDFNGDGKDDILLFTKNTSEINRGKVGVGLSTGADFITMQSWYPFFCLGNEICAVGDFDGDAKDDILYFGRDEAVSFNYGSVWVALSSGVGFAESQQWQDLFCTGEDICLIGDFDGNGQDDIINFIHTEVADHLPGTILVAFSNGSEFITSQFGQNAFCGGNDTCIVGDVNGDRMSDIIRFVRPIGADMGGTWVALATGNGFDAPQLWNANFCIPAEITCTIGDFNGDGRHDLVRFLQHSVDASGATLTQGQIDIAYSTGTEFEAAITLPQSFCSSAELCTVGDANGDGLDDIVIFARGAADTLNHGSVWVALSQAATTGIIATPDMTTALSATCTLSQPLGWITYTIRAGDTLVELAGQTGTTSAELQAVNCISNPGTLYVGQQISLPGRLSSLSGVTSATEACAVLHSNCMGISRSDITATPEPCSAGRIGCTNTTATSEVLATPTPCSTGGIGCTNTTATSEVLATPTPCAGQFGCTNTAATSEVLATSTPCAGQFGCSSGDAILTGDESELPLATATCIPGIFGDLCRSIHSISN
jgi:LysM repeat protein